MWSASSRRCRLRATTTRRRDRQKLTREFTGEPREANSRRLPDDAVVRELLCFQRAPDLVVDRPVQASFSRG